MTIRWEILFWLGAALLLVFLVATLHEILLPFVLGLLIAYLLDPIADSFENAGISRLVATIIIVILTGGILIALALILGPLLIKQSVALFEKLPGFLNDLQQVMEHYGKILFGPEFALPELVEEGPLRQMARKYAGSSSDILRSVWSGGMALVSFLSLILVTPVVAFYMLYDWDRMIAFIDSWLPRDHADVIRSLGCKIDTVVAGFLRGQVTVCALLGMFYAISLMIVGLDFALLIGVGAGLLSFIPYVGALTGFVIGTAVALSQFWPDWWQIGMVVLVFLMGQFIEGNFLTPKIVGDKVRLHPVWLIFALFVFGYLFGFVGMLIAVPVAGALGVLVRFGLEVYLESPLYLGSQPHTDAQDSSDAPALEAQNDET